MEVNLDLQIERDNATFDAVELTYIKDGGAKVTQRRRYIESLVCDDPDFQQEDPNFLSRDELYTSAVRRGVMIEKKILQLNITDAKEYAAIGKRHGTAIELHSKMFVPTLIGQASEKQKRKWLPLEENLHIIGTFAQTELGHGTFVRGLETTSTYDPKAQEFVVHSPTLSSTKLWIGNLGKTVTHAIVMAQLITNGKQYGVHPFIVPLRSLENHMPLPGVTVGDIGPKMRFNSNDNGFLRLDHVRIPRDNMLMKHTRVLADGTYVKPPTNKLVYGTLVYARVGYLLTCTDCLAMACTIVSRYSAVRRQSEMQPGAREAHILDYQSQQLKILPYIATTYAFYTVERRVSGMYDRLQQQMATGNFSHRQKFNAVTAGLKGFVSYVTNSGIETCRLACVGHGYSHATNYKFVKVKQQHWYLIKCAGSTLSGDVLSGQVPYLNEPIIEKCAITSESDLLKLDILVDIYKHRAQRLIVTVSAFVGSVKDTKMSDSLKLVLTSLCQLYALYGIYQDSRDFMMDCYLSGHNITSITHHITSMLATLRPNAVALVDAFDIRDEILCSILGRYDGNVYENMYKWAKKSPLNKNEVHDFCYEYLKPFLRSQPSKL
uniref:Acyl-coenzyme A oxidase n=1 Tax=Saccoglossus kowalevskii TaxID=10224 RepID=A0ABM0H186_SACKO|nr:PREDICTED: peroxisomal acyl-coenzyme A oxidase 1-like [Saccoglossus kowalevskii]